MTHTIIFDDQNPFIIQNSKFNSTYTNILHIMNIKFPIASSGLHYKQYIALKFPHITTGISGNELLNQR